MSARARAPARIHKQQRYKQKQQRPFGSIRVEYSTLHFSVGMKFR